MRRVAFWPKEGASFRRQCPRRRELRPSGGANRRSGPGLADRRPARRARPVRTPGRATGAARAEVARRAELAGREAHARHLGRLAELLGEFRNSLVGQVGPALSAPDDRAVRRSSPTAVSRASRSTATVRARVSAAPAIPLDRHSGSETDLATSPCGSRSASRSTSCPAVRWACWCSTRSSGARRRAPRPSARRADPARRPLPTGPRRDPRGRRERATAPRDRGRTARPGPLPGDPGDGPDPPR